jgi:hypothetical protein
MKGDVRQVKPQQWFKGGLKPHGFVLGCDFTDEVKTVQNNGAGWKLQDLNHRMGTAR